MRSGFLPLMNAVSNNIRSQRRPFQFGTGKKNFEIGKCLAPRRFTVYPRQSFAGSQPLSRSQSGLRIGPRNHECVAARIHVRQKRDDSVAAVRVAWQFPRCLLARGGGAVNKGGAMTNWIVDFEEIKPVLIEDNPRI